MSLIPPVSTKGLDVSARKLTVKRNIVNAIRWAGNVGMNVSALIVRILTHKFIFNEFLCISLIIN